jgi:hypothetical protein
LAILAALLSSCAQPTTPLAASPSASRSPRPTEPVDAAQRISCATRVLNQLVNAINGIDEQAIARLISSGGPGQPFKWFWITTEGANSSYYSVEEARRALLDRAKAGERWRLVSVRAESGASWHGGVDAEIHLQRTTAAGRTIPTGGKTALSCLDDAIFVLSVGDE